MARAGATGGQGQPRSSRQPPASSEGEDKDGDASSSWQLAPGYFDRDAAADDDEAKAWVELITAGTFSDDTLAQAVPLSYQIGDEWLELLLASEASFGGSWLHDASEWPSRSEETSTSRGGASSRASARRWASGRLHEYISFFLSFLSVVLRRNRE